MEESAAHLSEYWVSFQPHVMDELRFEGDELLALRGSVSLIGPLMQNVSFPLGPQSWSEGRVQMLVIWTLTGNTHWTHTLNTHTESTLDTHTEHTH